MKIGFIGLGIMGKSRLGADQGGTPKPIAEQVETLARTHLGRSGS